MPRKQTTVADSSPDRVVGTDIAERFLAEARRSAGRQAQKLEFRLQRAAEITEADAYDVVLAHQMTLGLMDDAELRRQFAALRRALKSGGRLLFVFAGVRAFPGRASDTSRGRQEKNGKFILTEKTLKDGYRTEFCIVIDPAKDEIIDYLERQCGIALDEVLSLLRAAGFAKVDVFNDLDRVPATPDRFGVFVCRRER